jgi:hypothetical protein
MDKSNKKKTLLEVRKDVQVMINLNKSRANKMQDVVDILPEIPESMSSKTLSAEYFYNEKKILHLNFVKELEMLKSIIK